MKKMSKTEYQIALADLGLNHPEAATFFEVDVRTSRGWANGRSSVPTPVAKWLRYMRAKQLTTAQVDAAIAT
jgi:hypothetical protein